MFLLNNNDFHFLSQLSGRYRSFPAVIRTPILLAVFLVACTETTPEDARQAREGMAERNRQPDSVEGMLDARVPAAKSGDPGWAYAQRVTADFDGDDKDETAVLISDVTLDRGGAPLWEDGHRWQLYVEESDGTVTRLYAKFIPRGRVTADVGIPSAGKELYIVVLEHAPDRMGVYEFEYRGPQNADVRKRLERDLDASKQFTGAMRP
jgi:hypothetical protein